MSEFKQTIEDLNAGWSSHETRTQPYTIKEEGKEDQHVYLRPKNESRGSVKERAVRMEMADEEASLLEADQQQAEANPSFFQKLLKRFRGDKSESVEPDAQKRLDDVVVDRVIDTDLSLIQMSTDVSKLLKYLDYDGTKLLHNQKDVKQFTPEQMELAKKRIFDAVEKRKEQMEKNVIAILRMNIEEVTNLDSLFNTIGMWKPRDGEEYPDKDIDVAVKRTIKPRIEAEHHSGFVASTLATEVEELFEKRYKELKKAEQKK